jgi:hypothetical protein
MALGLPDSYTQKPHALPALFDAILDAQPPERFSLRFLENLGFTSTNDRLFISILKDLGFLNRDGTPQPRYYEFMDRTQSKQILAEGIRDAFSALFAINTKANELSVDDVKNKLRALYAGTKDNRVIGSIARTFTALCEYADFSVIPSKITPVAEPVVEPVTETKTEQNLIGGNGQAQISEALGRIHVSGLQYHINIVLPDTRDQAVYDAIFKSLREHLG